MRLCAALETVTFGAAAIPAAVGLRGTALLQREGGGVKMVVFLNELLFSCSPVDVLSCFSLGGNSVGLAAQGNYSV